MGIMTFQLPAELPAEAARALQRACLAGGPDNMPWPTEAERKDGQLSVRKAVDESGHFQVPWPVEQIGCLMNSSATLMERAAPYQLLTELRAARSTRCGTR